MRAIKVGNVNVFPFRDMQELMDYTFGGMGNVCFHGTNLLAAALGIVWPHTKISIPESARRGNCR